MKEKSSREERKLSEAMSRQLLFMVGEIRRPFQEPETRHQYTKILHELKDPLMKAEAVRLQRLPLTDFAEKWDSVFSADAKPNPPKIEKPINYDEYGFPVTPRRKGW